MTDEAQPALTHIPGPATGGEQREHHMRLLPKYYRQVEAGRKTIEVRVATPQKRSIAVGDTVVFHNQGSDRELDVIVQRITRYASFEDLLGAEDPTRIDPDGPRKELLTNLQGLYPPSKEALGALAFEFDHRPARPGRPMPMTPTRYAQTVPHHTVRVWLDRDHPPVHVIHQQAQGAGDHRVRVRGHQPALLRGGPLRAAGAGRQPDRPGQPLARALLRLPHREHQRRHRDQAEEHRLRRKDHARLGARCS